MVKVILKNGKHKTFTDIAVVSYSKREGKVYVENQHTHETIKEFEADKVCCVEFE